MISSEKGVFGSLLTALYVHLDRFLLIILI